MKWEWLVKRKTTFKSFKYGMGGKGNIVMDLKSPDNVKIGGDLGGLVSEAWKKVGGLHSASVTPGTHY